MHLTKVAFVFTGIFIHSGIATFGYGGWGGDSHYSTPDNTDNKCSTDQSKGYNWDGLAIGSFDSYGSNKFSKWSCTNSLGKRDLLTKRKFQSKCISSNLDDEPSIGCDGEDYMSIDKYEVSSDVDADIECHYEMPNKTVCKEYHSCKSGGTVIQNTQCGGAKSVTFKPAESFKGKGCNIGVHSIGFNCGTASSTAPAVSKTESIPAYGSSSPPVYATTSSESATETSSTSSVVEITTDTTPYTSPTSTAATSSTAAPTDSVPSHESSACVPSYGASCSTTSEIPSSTATSRETSPVETSAPEYSTSSSPSFSLTGTPTFSSLSTGIGGSVPSYNTSLTYKVPAHTQSTSSSSSNALGTTSIGSYSTGTIYSTSCETFTSSGSITTLTRSYAVSTTVAAVTSPDKESSAVETSSTTAPSYSGPEPSSPALLPSCLNTWMYLTDCSSNSDSSCYCKNSDYINKVYGCLSSWSQSADNATNGVSYLMGLCAPYISENPAIITGCPSTITPAAYTPPAATSAISSGTPTSTITLQSTLTSTATLPASPSSTEVSPENSSPAPTPPASVPCTTITYSQDITVPATYAFGSSQGSVIPSSSITSAIITTITVPQVQITTYTVTESGSTLTAPGLGYGVPATTSAMPGQETSSVVPVQQISDGQIQQPTGTLVMSIQTAAPIYGTAGFTTSASYSAPSGIVPYEGAGVKTSASRFGVVGLGMVAALLVL